jgi:hypothetical protein
MLIYDQSIAHTIHADSIDHVPAKYKRAVALLDATDWDGHYLHINGIGMKSWNIGYLCYILEAGGIDE